MAFVLGLIIVIVTGYVFVAMLLGVPRSIALARRQSDDGKAHGVWFPFAFMAIILAGGLRLMGVW